jgi:hypothetical protein
MISMKHLTRDGSDTPAPTSAGPANSNDEALRLSLGTLHGPLLGPVLAEAAKKMRAEAVARLCEQNARLTVAKEALVTATAEGERRVRGAYAAMERARSAWQAATESYERERTAAQSACAPFQNQVHAIIAAMNGVDASCGGKVKQWDSGDHVTAPRAMPAPDA